MINNLGCAQVGQKYPKNKVWLSVQNPSLQQIPTQHDMLPQHLVYKNELNRDYVITLARNDETP